MRLELGVWRGGFQGRPGPEVFREPGSGCWPQPCGFYGKDPGEALATVKKTRRRGQDEKVGRDQASDMPDMVQWDDSLVRWDKTAPRIVG